MAYESPGSLAAGRNGLCAVAAKRHCLCSECVGEGQRVPGPRRFCPFIVCLTSVDLRLGCSGIDAANAGKRGIIIMDMGHDPHTTC